MADSTDRAAPTRRSRREERDRREAGDQPSSAHGPAAPTAVLPVAEQSARDGTPKKSWWRTLGPRRWIVLGLLVLVVCGIWLGARILIVKSELEAAQRVVEFIRDDGAVEASVPILGEHAAIAASVGGDPIWRAAEFIPWAGDNLRAVRLAAQSLDFLANDVGTPALAAMSSEGDKSLLERVLPVLNSGGTRAEELARDVTDVESSGALIGPVRAGIDQVATVMEVVAPAMTFGPQLLGADGPKNYLLVFQNNAESVGLGGSAASQTLITANAGSIAIDKQASSANFQEFVPVDVTVPDSAITLYSDYLLHHINTSSSRPDFPTMAKIVTAFWQRDISNDRIDGVVSIDPIALAGVLRATGPITLATGDVMTSDNAVQLLLSDVYQRWNAYEAPLIVDGFFASVANEVFTKIASGDFDIQAMLSAVRGGIDTGDILFYSADEALQQQIAGERVSGILPQDTPANTTIGVYFRDESASKIDYYMRSNIDATQTCTGDTSSVSVAATLHLDIDQAAADALPDYVKSEPWGSEKFRTQVYIYGPVGGAVTSATVDGRDVAVTDTKIDDLGRPVAWITTYLAPGEQATARAEFSAPITSDQLTVRSTPMVNTSTGTTTSCG